MTGDMPNPRRDSWLVRAARIVFDEPALSSIVLPAVADLQIELHEAGRSPFSRATLHVRGLWMFLKLAVLAPAAHAVSPVTGRPSAVAARGSRDSLTLLVAASYFVISAWFALGALGVVTLLAGLCCAAWMRRWNDRFPARVGTSRNQDVWRSVEINMSSVHVGDSAGGLILAAGSTVIVLLAVPSARWFLCASVAAGVVLAALLGRRGGHRATGHGTMSLGRL